jgi:putative transposase
MMIEPSTRVIVSIVVSLEDPTTAEAQRAIAEGMRPGRQYTPAYGKFGSLRRDNALIFSSLPVQEMGLELGFVDLPITPGEPGENGKMERYFRTLDERYLTKLPGYTKGAENPDGSPMIAPGTKLLSIHELWEPLEEAVRHYNYERPHSGLGDRTPAQAWADELTFVEEADEDDLFRFSLAPVGRGGLRRVDRRGVKVFGRYYQHLALGEFIGKGKEVTVRGIPHDQRKCFVFDGDRFICEAWPNLEGPEEERQRLADESRRRQGEVQERSRQGMKRQRDRFVDKERHSNVASSSDRFEPVTLSKPERRPPVRRPSLLDSDSKVGQVWTAELSEGSENPSDVAQEDDES